MNDLEAPFEIQDQIVNNYRYSYGGISRFFRELKENRRITATRCQGCGKVWCPPRLHCSHCYQTTGWEVLGNKGTVRSATFCYYVPSNYSLHDYMKMPYVLALIQMDGADTALYNVVHVPEVVIGSVTPGMRVRAVFREKREGRLTDFYFVPAG